MKNESNSKNPYDPALKVLQAIDKTDSLIKEKKELNDKLTIKRDEIIRLERKTELLTSINNDLKKSISTIQTDSNQKIRDLQLKNRTNRYLNKLFTFFLILIFVGVISMFVSVTVTEYSNDRIGYLKNKIESLNQIDYSAKATVIGLYMDGEDEILQYKNTDGFVWDVRNYKKITADSINIGDDIVVNYSTKNNRLTFRYISLLD